MPPVEDGLIEYVFVGVLVEYVAFVNTAGQDVIFLNKSAQFAQDIRPRVMRGRIPFKHGI